VERNIYHLTEMKESENLAGKRTEKEHQNQYE